MIELVILTLFGCPSGMASFGIFCMDRHEAPNTEGSDPLVMQSALGAQKQCRDQGKRLCYEFEWEIACRLSSGPCNNNKQWMEWDRKTVNSKSEIARLWQGTPSGSIKTCSTPNGVYDLTGNVEEWVISEEGRDWPYTLKGGWWAKITPCHKSNDAHEPRFKFYQTGYRCCRDTIIQKIFRM